MGYSVRTVLRIVGVLEATWYARKKREQEGEKPRIQGGGRPHPGYSLTKDNKRISDEQIIEWLLEAVAGEGNAYGYRKLTICLQREHNLVINKKKVYRLCQELDLLRPQRQVKIKYPRKIAENRGKSWNYGDQSTVGNGCEIRIYRGGTTILLSAFHP